MAAGEDEARFSSFKLSWETLAGIGVISAVYFANIFLKASRKLFWFDELFAVYLCRVPTFRDTWGAVTHGADFNPPLFYLVTRFAQRLFGDGLVATRLPESIGVWIFCVCLFFLLLIMPQSVSKVAALLLRLVGIVFLPFFVILALIANFSLFGPWG
jgi:hypothetical protein